MTTNFAKLWSFFFYFSQTTVLDPGFLALLSESVLSPRGSSDLLLSAVSDRPFNLKVRVKKKFKVAPRNQSTVALIKPHYLIFIFHPTTLSPSSWLIWLAARVEEPRTVTLILATFQVLLKPFVYICLPFPEHMCHQLYFFDRTARPIRLTTPTPTNCPVLLLNLQIRSVIIWMKLSWGQVKVVCDKPGRYD